MIKIVKLKRLIFESKTGYYCIYAGKAGKADIRIQINGDQPKILKTVEYKLIGEFKTTLKYQTFMVDRWEKLSGRVNLARPVPKLNF